MTPADRGALMRLLQRAAVGLDAPLPSPERVDFYADALSDLSIDQIEAALRHLARTSPHFPKPSDILGAVVAGNDGRPGAEEAWALAVQFFDESATITWTDEIAAAYGVCRPLYVSGDRVGARMAFKEAYLRFVESSRLAGVPVRWSASLGCDAGLRRESLLAARSAGRLTDLSTTLQIAGSSKSARPVSLLEMAKKPEIPETAKAALRALAERFSSRMDAPSLDSTAKADTSVARAAAAAQVQAYEASRNASQEGSA